MFEASLGPAQHHENLTIFPILAEKGRELPYVLMADALATGVLTIGEKDGGRFRFSWPRMRERSTSSFSTGSSSSERSRTG